MGRVALADGQLADQVAVRVKGSNCGTTPDADSRFQLRLAAGW